MVHRVLAARGLQDPQDAACDLSGVLRPSTLHGLDAAVALLTQALRQRWQVLVVGDFDADGATSTALTVRALRAMGVASIDFLVPNRFDFGYGLTPELVAVALAQSQPDLIITVDSGIACHAGIAAAQAAGVRVLVTDHHLPGATVPPADAIVNPNQPDCRFASKALAGVGVVFYVLSALRAHLRAIGWFAEQGLTEPVMADYLDLVALGTVADVVPLDANNRRLVHQGIQRLRAGRGCPGVLALLQVAERPLAQLTATDLGFSVGPRLNAAGRLDDMAEGILCLLSEDPVDALRRAQQLDTLNRARREIESGMQHEADAVLTQLQLNGHTLPAGLVVYDRFWHQGVIGILAGRLKEQHHRPVIAFAPATAVPADHTPPQIKGSARSIPGIHIRDVLERIHTQHPGLIDRFGGHAMAAGLTLATERLPAFQQAFEAVVRDWAPEVLRTPVLATDGPLKGNELTESMARLLRDVLPWGQAFPEPLFEGVFEVVSSRWLKERHLKLEVIPDDDNRVHDAIAFSAENMGWPAGGCQRVRLAYHLDVNHFRGRERVQLRVKDLQPLD